MSMLLKVAEYFTPVLKESKFRETGVLTPEEFVAAGDHLVYHCPSWKWQSGEASKIKPYLPEGKQYLITKQVPCFKRYKDVESLKFLETVIDENDGEGGWVDTQYYNEGKDDAEVTLGEEALESTISGRRTKGSTASTSRSESAKNSPATNNNIEDDGDDSEAEDIENYLSKADDFGADDLNELNDDACPVNEQFSKLSLKADGDTSGLEPSDIVSTRTYDLYITYDKYYQTPRLWLIGFDEFCKPLTMEQMYEDISQDHAKKTVTMESHPHIPLMMPSVHPCKHAEMMKKIMQTMDGNGKELEVYKYLIIFLKFVQSIIPTIEYDFTQNFSM